MKRHLLHIIILIFLFLNGVNAYAIETDTVKVAEAVEVPIIDGSDEDLCWENTPWQHINKFWIPYNAQLDSVDYYARYKVCWSSSDNLLYFLVEVTDDIFISGYKFPDVGYPNFDVVELFIDEDKSGGAHIYDNSTENAENAFAYHILPQGNPYNTRVINDFVVCDMDGVGSVVDYASHFPEFALFYSGVNYVWEFSMKVYDDTYNHSNSELSQAPLNVGKEMGFTIAYCENDYYETGRDNFIGSVPGNPAKLESGGTIYNDQWKNADDFGVIKLVESDYYTKPIVSFLFNIVEPHNITVYPSPADSRITYSIRSGFRGKINVKITNIIGVNVMEFCATKTNYLLESTFSVVNLDAGIYVISSEINGRITLQKFIIKH